MLNFTRNYWQKIRHMKTTRKIKPTKFSVAGFLPFKDGKSIPYESILERDCITYFAFRKDVTNIVSQPITIPFIKNGRKYHYTPDFYIEFDTTSGLKPLIIEVKPTSKWQKHWRDWSDKWKAMINYCKENGYQFHIFDESRIYHQALDNIQFLARYQRISYEPTEFEEIKKLLLLHQSLTLSDLKVALSPVIPKQHIERLVFHLIFVKKLEIDLFEPINDSSLVWLG